MKYYKIKIQSIFPNKDRVLGHANGEFVPNHEEYFSKMMEGEIIENCPVFDYFHLQSFGDKKDWEWRLQDAHGGMGNYPGNANWYISDDLKLLLENFKIAPKYHFYETRLLYKGQKLKYWIFQFPIKPLKNVDFQKSNFYYQEDNIKVQVNIKSEDDFMKTRRKLLLDDDIELKCSKISFKNTYDLIYNLPCGDTLCSETLKIAIETMGIIGFEFSELDYEVVIDL